MCKTLVKSNVSGDFSGSTKYGVETVVLSLGRRCLTEIILSLFFTKPQRASWNCLWLEQMCHFPFLVASFSYGYEWDSQGDVTGPLKP